MNRFHRQTGGQIWRFPTLRRPQELDGLFHGKPQSNMDDLGVPPFMETSTNHGLIVKQWLQ